MLVLATVVMIVVSVSSALRCRLHWTRFSRRTKWSLLLVSAVAVVTYAATLASHWRFLSPVVNEILGFDSNRLLFFVGNAADVLTTETVVLRLFRRALVD